ncbi:uncharacterized protein LOC130447366 [Diorhabda sublineata]|uniref:uncharacterized protein LOC130447366 n=1 Tax=Diorhabda sublineata TaxID=1163346 RepID=UPI0024E17DC2|nr:uncharacterized protein LOC130447366 [Diorhabda sublineata]
MKSLIFLTFALLSDIRADDEYLLPSKQYNPEYAKDRYLIHLDNEKYSQTPAPRPYAFGYAAGRYPGDIDRTHSEISDGSGVVQGSYSYVDPRHKIRKVEYTADKYGFHPITNDNVPDLPSDTPIVAAAKVNHLQKYAAIVQEQQSAPNHIKFPSDTPEVQYAKNKHLALFQAIAAEHARLATEQEAKNQQEKIQNNVNGGEEHYTY